MIPSNSINFWRYAPRKKARSALLAFGKAKSAECAAEIGRLVSEGTRQFSDFVVLYRTNAQSRVLEEMFLRQGIPYRVLAGLRFYDRKEIKDSIAYLRVIHNPADSVSLKRIINEPKRGIGATTIGYAQDISDSLGTSIYDVIKEANLYSELLRASVKLNDFTNMIDLLRRSQPEMRLTDFVDLVLDKTGYRQALMLENSVEAQSRLENLDEFMSEMCIRDRGIVLITTQRAMFVACGLLYSNGLIPDNRV